MDDKEKFVRIYFSTHYQTEHPDHTLAIIGSIPELGQWDAERAVHAVETAYQPGNWILPIELRSDVAFEWKWVVICKNSLKVIRWEECQNKSTHLQDNIWTCRAPWNHGAEYRLMYTYRRTSQSSQRFASKRVVQPPKEKNEKHEQELQPPMEKNENHEQELDEPRTDVEPAGRRNAWSIVTWSFRKMVGFYRLVAGFMLICLFFLFALMVPCTHL